jgi:hypothetical protein
MRTTGGAVEEDDDDEDDEEDEDEDDEENEDEGYGDGEAEGSGVSCGIVDVDNLEVEKGDDDGVDFEMKGPSEN